MKVLKTLTPLLALPAHGKKSAKVIDKDKCRGGDECIQQ
jgi:hypothetical protein